MNQKIEVGQEYYGLLYRYEIFRCHVDSQDPNIPNVYNVISGEAQGQMQDNFLFKSKKEAIEFLKKEIETLDAKEGLGNE